MPIQDVLKRLADLREDFRKTNRDIEYYALALLIEAAMSTTPETLDILLVDAKSIAALPFSA